MMRIRDSLITAAAALATMALTLTVVGPAPLDAALPEELQLPPAPVPSLTVDGVELTVDGELEEKEPMAHIVAINHSDQPATVTAHLSLYAQAPPRPTARMISMPVEVWSQPCVVQLAPGETRELDIVADALPPNQEGYFMLLAGEHHLASSRFAPEGLQRVAFDFPVEPTVELDVITF